jgi:hypothetical protein
MFCSRKADGRTRRILYAPPKFFGEHNNKFEHRISLSYNLKKCYDLGHLSFSLKGANQINMSKLDRRLRMLQTKFGDHPSIISVGNDVQRFFYFHNVALAALKKGQSN